MKHTLKFSVSTLYRQDSDFLLNTIISLLYVIPLTMIGWYVWLTFNYSNMSADLKDSNEKLTTITRKFQAKTKKEAPDKDMEAFFTDKYSRYTVLMTACNISWAEIIEELESITPNGIRYQRISIRPDKEIKIKLEGRAIDVSMLTDFLRVLYENKSFKDPILKSHRKSNLRDAKSTEVAFALELVYIINGEGSKK